MRVAITLVLFSLYENAFAGQNTTLSAINLNEIHYIAIEGETDKATLDICSDCLWIGEKSIKDTVNYAIENRENDIINIAKSEDHAFVVGFKINSNLSVLPYWQGIHYLDEKYTCDKSFICMINIVWDGRHHFKTKKYQTQVWDAKIGTLQYPVWEYNFKEKEIHIIHRFGGGVEREINYNQLSTFTKGNVSVEWWKFWKFGKVSKEIEFYPGTINIQSTVSKKQYYIEYIATVFGFNDTALTS